ncbi:MAG: cyclic pyranopterin monophosphate synthase MoaC [Chloroflexi bacterium]|nr:cyclic pyranopterin monophosphate synthase MoaC [Chloroflexota bacterium]
MKNKKNFTHIDNEGEIIMVDVGDKKNSERIAIAKCEIILSPETINLILENKLQKGDVILTSKIAGIMSAKNTHNIIPLCHQIPLSKIDLNIKIIKDENKLTIQSTVKANWNTGVEMEALTAVSIAALTIYDMCKSIDKAIEIRTIKLIKKSGGNSGDFINK